MPGPIVEAIHPVDPESPGAKRIEKLGGRLKANIQSAFERAQIQDRDSDGRAKPYPSHSLEGSIRDAAKKYGSTLPEYWSSWTKSAETSYRLSSGVDTKFADLISRSIDGIGKDMHTQLKAWAEVTSPESAYDPDRIAEVAEKLLSALEQAWNVVKFDFAETPYRDRPRLTYGATLDAALVGLADQIHDRLTTIGAGQVVDRITMRDSVKEMVARAKDDPMGTLLNEAAQKAYGEVDDVTKVIAEKTAVLDGLKAERQKTTDALNDAHASEEDIKEATKKLQTLAVDITTATEDLARKQQLLVSKQESVKTVSQRGNDYAAALRDAQLALATGKAEEFWRSARDAVLNGLNDLARPDVRKALRAVLDGNFGGQLEEWRKARTATRLDPVDLQARATAMATTIDTYLAAFDAALGVAPHELGDAARLWGEGMAALTAIRARVLMELDSLFKRGAFAAV